jgi:hypothetical protein
LYYLLQSFLGWLRYIALYSLAEKSIWKIIPRMS